MKKVIKKETTKVKSVPGFPSNLLTPVAHFLSARLNVMEKRKKQISKEDPFKDPARVDDNAAPDIEADEQLGSLKSWAQLRRQVGFEVRVVAVFLIAVDADQRDPEQLRLAPLDLAELPLGL